MNRLFSLFLISLLAASCANNQKQLAYEKNILGDWVKFDINHKSIYDEHGYLRYLPEPPGTNPGYSFYPDHTFDKRTGYFKVDTLGGTTYFGTFSKFKITGDSLAYLNPEDNKWNRYKIIKLTADTLKLEQEERNITYIHYQPQKSSTPEFDTIILSVFRGASEIKNTMINKDGISLFKGANSKTGLFSGIISKEKYEQLQNNFRKVDFDTLKTEYHDNWTDGTTITTTFVKKGKIYKSIFDYNENAGYLFTWAYIPLEYLNQTISLKQVPCPGYLANFDVVYGCQLKKGDMILDVKQSETFLLFDYLRNGKECNRDFKPMFKLHGYFKSGQAPYDIDTDGRFYKFIVKGKPVTIDIGFNFYDLNAQNWAWRKINKDDY